VTEVQNGYCVVGELGRVIRSRPSLGGGTVQRASEVVREVARIHAVEVTDGVPAPGPSPNSVTTACGRGMARQHVDQSTTWEEQLLKPTGPYLGASAPFCDSCKVIVRGLPSPPR